VNLRDGTVVHSSWDRGAIIDDDVSIGHNEALIHACTLKSGSFVGGVSALVTDYVVELSGARVAAGALVTPDQRIPEGQLWVGRPARFMRTLGEEDFAMFRHNATQYFEPACHEQGVPIIASIPAIDAS